MAFSYSAVNLVGTLLPGGVVQRIGEGDPDLPGIDPQSYDMVEGESVRRLANVKFSYLRDSYADFMKRRNRGRTGRAGRDDWLSVLFRELNYRQDFERLPQGIAVDGQAFPVSHVWHRNVPVHLVPWGAELDRRPAGAARGRTGAAPHPMMQRLLNQSPQHLWGLLSNGQRLRVLRDSTSLVASSYLEFDLEAIFEGELFADFVLLYRLAHSSRLRARDEQAGPSSCMLEEWRAYGARQGERALSRLRGGVEVALEILGTGFLDHPANRELRERIGRELSLADFKRSLLRLVYKIIFWMVIEDRNVLFVPTVEPAARERYDTYLSSRRLRRLAGVRRYSRHGDLWESVKMLFGVLGSESGSPLLGLPGLGGVFEPSALDEPLADAQLTNTALLQAVEALNVLAQRKSGRRYPVDWEHLGSEELGSVYEALLELHPRWDPCRRRFSFERLSGNERKKTGAYYTPASLVEQLLDTALEPLLDEACAAQTPAERIDALLEITVCDPACGSGHFLIGAARRIARRIAIEEVDEPEPPLPAVRKALRTVISRCIYGVDINEMAVELATISLWLEAIEPGKPLGYLEGNIRVGNSLLGVTPALLNAGIPDAAFAPLEGDERPIVTALRKQNATERRGERPLGEVIDTSNLDLAETAQAIAHLAPCETLADVHVQARRGRLLDEERRIKREIADAWCAAFVAPKIKETRPYALTQAVLERIGKGERSPAVDAARQVVRSMARQYRFFHWHIEFPHIFRTAKDGVEVDAATGWRGGFSCVLMNPLWERVKLQEQEFFASQSTEIAQAPNAAARKRLVAALVDSDIPEERELHNRWVRASREAEGTSHMLRTAGRHALTGRGDINTYAVFAETGRLILGFHGMFGSIVPTGIAIDATTQYFFKNLVTTHTLVSLYDFENEDKIFQMHNQFRFSLLTLVGAGRLTGTASFAFRLRRPNQIAERAYELTSDEIHLINPNTGTAPTFSTRRDAEIVLGIYRRIPVLWDETEDQGGPWGLSFVAMLHMANDSHLFCGQHELIAAGWTLEEGIFVRSGQRMLPLFEAKLAYHYDHRYSTYEGATQEQLNKGTLPRLDEAAHVDPNRVSQPRYWVTEEAVASRLKGRWEHSWLLGWRDVCRSVDERTLISTVLPRTAVGDKFLLMLPAKILGGLQANLSSLCLDYVLRQKFSGPSLKYFVVKQLPVLPPGQYEMPTQWDPTVRNLEAWIRPRVLELTYTAYDLASYARDLGDDGPPFAWDPQRRELIRAELDAAYFHLYGVDRDDTDYILDTFKVLREREMRIHGEYRTKQLVLASYDAMARAAISPGAYQTRLDPAPGKGPRHPR
ncbi:Eco57I restriction-modification methylase domain-containing protein [Plantactinospora sonchi]|uniref:site-specific DNA-methyltransferase (adenine-specific) n=1 Tax=Plantactinospora sonchi TaxID=1544735 RepID=A0ABU7RXG2_9ACTN